jgi:hypothetical protein
MKNVIGAFKETMEEAGLKFKAKYNNEVTVFKKQSQNLKKKLDGYEDDGLRRWKKFKTDINHDGNGIGRTMKNLFKS